VHVKTTVIARRHERPSHPDSPRWSRAEGGTTSHFISDDIPLTTLRRPSLQDFDLAAFAMKFSSSLKFNAVPEWWDEYISYDALKKAVYQLEKQQLGLADSTRDLRDLEANEETALMGHVDHASTDALFVPLLDRELRKICMFYETQERELLDEVAQLERLVQQQEEVGPDAGHQYMDADTEDDDEDDEDEDDFNATSPPVSRDHTRSPSRKPSRRHGRSLSSAAGGPSGSRKRGDTAPDRRYSISSAEDHGDLEASIASLRSQHFDHAGQPSNSTGDSPKITTRAMNKINKMRDSIASLTGPQTVWTAKNNYATDIQLLFKRRITNLYLSVTSLRSYIELNYSGFRKILKNTTRSRRASYKITICMTSSSIHHHLSKQPRTV